MNDTVEITHTKLFINNEWVESLSSRKFPVVNPVNEEVIAHVEEGDKDDIDRAVKAAREAFRVGSTWRSMNASDRGRLIHKLSELITRDIENIARLEVLNSGKPLTRARFEIMFAIRCLEYYSGWADKISGKTIPVDGPFFTYTRHEPIGVCGQIIPWNYPAILLTWKLGPALACGNTVVVKPAEQTPLTALYIASLIKEAGFPPGVVNIVPGFGPTAGHALSMHMDVNKIAFTGSTLTGRKVQEASAKSNLKRVSLELGGKSPFIILDVDDTMLEKAAQDTAASIFTNEGQSCCASSRIFVHENVHDKFVEKLKQIAESKIHGDPNDPKTTNGTLISALQMQRVLDYIKSGKDEGARCVTGGERLGNKGYFVKPTIFVDVKDEMKIAREEIFGPVVAIFKFNDVNDVLRRANDTSYGLAAGIYSNDVNVVLDLANKLEAGSVWVNCFQVLQRQAPFGGFKQSGFGRELGEYGLHEYMEIKTVTVRMN